MRSVVCILPFAIVALVLAMQSEHSHAQASTDRRDVCPRPPAGSTVMNPPTLTKSRDGNYHLTARNVGTGPVDPVAPNYDYRFCMRGNDRSELQGPVLRMSPGETINLIVSDRLRFETGFPSTHIMPAPDSTPCALLPSSMQGDMTLTNLHYHGLNIPPRCGADETINTVIAPPGAGGTSDFLYHFTIPSNEPPGLYWYHPHMHGVSQQQILGGMTGVMVINGMENLFPEVAHLTERIFVLRDLDKPDPADNPGASPDEPWKNVSINYVPVVWNGTTTSGQPANLAIGQRERQFWRVANASADTAFVLKLQHQESNSGNWHDQPLELLAFDGVPQTDDTGSAAVAITVKRIVIPPAGRAEFIVTGPPRNAEARFYSDDYNSYLLSTNPNPGAVDETDRQPARVLATLTVEQRPGAKVAAAPAVKEDVSKKVFRFMRMRDVPPPRRRAFFFTKDPSDDGNFFITPEGQIPRPFMMDAPPDVTIHMPTVEDWTIENRDNESHVFHIHQIHFRVLEINGVAVDEKNEPTLRDTIEMAACRDWGNANPEDPYAGDGQFLGKNCRQPYRVKLRMDFRDQDIAGTSLFHCHILEHQDKGMMAKMLLIGNP
jgi:FtsP/CotA-like multicopper oxidase with cupredoxin domain